jgi:hypothetical protein
MAVIQKITCPGLSIRKAIQALELSILNADSFHSANTACEKYYFPRFAP